MRVCGPSVSKCFLNKYLPRSVGYVILAANDVRNAFFAIIHNNRKIVQRVIDSSGNYKIAKLLRIEGDLASYDIGKCDRAARVPKAYDIDLFPRLFLALLARDVRLIRVYQSFECGRMGTEQFSITIELVPRKAEPV